MQKNPVIAAVLLIFIAARGMTQEHQHANGEALGKVEFATSCNEAAQGDFNRAVTLLHSFQFSRAIEGFNAVLKEDPTCAIAYWGIALSDWSNPFAPGQKDKGQLQLGRQSVERGTALGAKTERERAYLAAASNLYSDFESTPQQVRVLAYRDAMGGLAAKYPEDHEAQIFYALALAVAEDPSDKTYADRLKAGNILEKLFADEPSHPGLAHYIIHAYDVPALAGRALVAAQRYAQIAPDAPHALHMPSHTFTRLGYWQESIDSNIAAAAAARRQGQTAEELHASDYETYAYLQTGQDAAAAAIVTALPEIASRFNPKAQLSGAGPPAAGYFALAAIPARYSLERQDWHQAEKLTLSETPFPYTDATTWFARGLGAARLGHAAAADEAATALEKIQDLLSKANEPYWAHQVEIQSTAVSAWSALVAGKNEEALRQMELAANMEDGTEKSAVTPGPLSPARELLGEMLLKMNKPTLALAQFEATLKKEPRRFRSLYGAAHAARLSGNTALSQKYFGELLTVCAHADKPGRPELREAREQVGVSPSTAPVPPVAAKKPYLVPSPFGTREDDYYWLRDDSRQSPEVLNYLDSENAYGEAAMAPTRELQQKLYEEIIGRLQPDEASVPVLRHGYWMYVRFEPGQDYPIYARRKGSMSAPEQVMLNGNDMAKGHEYFHIGSTSVSPDGKLLAYTEDVVGRLQYTLRVKDLSSGATLSDVVTNVEPEVVWAADNKTLLYIEKDPVTLLSVRVHQHKLGTDPAKDSLVYEEKDHSYYMSVRKSRSEKYIFIDLHSTEQSECRYADAADPSLRFKVVMPRESKLIYHVEHLGQDFIMRTNWQAPNYRIVRAPIATRADKHTWHDVIPTRADAFLENFEVSKKYLAVNERSGGLRKIRVIAWSGAKDQLIDATEAAYTMTLLPTQGFDSDTLRYVYTSLIMPPATYDYDMESGRKELKKSETVLGGFDTKNYSTEFLHATARDGTQVPVSLAYRKDTKLDGTAPLYQYAYGSYGDSSDPEFSSDWLSLLDRGFVVAIAHIRGGQELGRQWYEDGRLLHKKNTFTDFIDVTEYLVQHHYCAKDKVFAQGASAGGLLMGAVANMAPQDYRGIIAYVPYVDAVTTMLDESIPLTSNEFDEWGNPKQKVYYDYMLSYSPYDNVRAQDYPAMLVYTGLWDSQVQYFEPAKWVAKLRATKTDHQPLIFSVDKAAAHGGRSGRFQVYHDTAREYAFILNQLSINQ